MNVDFISTLPLKKNCKVLVIARNSGDVIRGMAGAILTHLERDDAVYVGILNESEVFVHTSQERGRHALEAWGVEQIYFINLHKSQQGSLGSSLDTTLPELISIVKPDCVYLPSPNPENPELAQLFRASHRVFRELDFFTDVYLYESSGGTFVNCTLDISALDNPRFDGLKGSRSTETKGLNSLRAQLAKRGGAAEGFWHFSAPELRGEVLHSCWKRLADDRPVISDQVSVILRTVCPDHGLLRAVESVVSQTYPSIELIVVNASGKSFSDDIKNSIHTLVPGPHIGLQIFESPRPLNRPEAANIGLGLSSSEWLCFLDEDDVFYSRHLGQMVAALQKSQKRVGYSGCLRDHGAGVEPYYGSPFYWDRYILENYIPNLTLLFRYDLIAEAGLFDHQFVISEDWDFFTRIFLVENPLYIEERTTQVIGHIKASEDFQNNQYNRFFIQKYWRLISADLVDSFLKNFCVPRLRLDPHRDDLWLKPGLPLFKLF